MDQSKSIAVAVRLAISGVMAVLLCAGADAAAQSYRPESFARPEAGPALAFGLGPSAVQQLNSELDADFQALGAFRGKRVDDYAGSRWRESAGPWSVYGRFYLINFRNQIGEQAFADTDVTWRRTGPSLAGRIYIGIHRRF